MRDQIDAFIRDTLSIDDIAALKRYFSDFVARFGFDLIAYYYLSEGFRRVPREKGFRISRFPEAYIEQYIREACFDIDPLMDEARQRAIPFHWFEIEDRPTLTLRQRKFFSDAREAGFRDGIVIPVFSRPGDIAYFSLGSTYAQVKFNRAQMLETQAICQHMHLRYNELTESVKTPKLSKREIEVLGLIAQGKSNAMMSDALGVSPNTIDTLVRRCFEKLGVSSRVEAALAGVAMGIILP